jgi:hypothetical protein
VSASQIYYRFFFKKMLKRRDMHFDDLPFQKIATRSGVSKEKTLSR